MLVGSVIMMIFGFILMLGDNLSIWERLLGIGAFGAGFWVLGERCR